MSPALRFQEEMTGYVAFGDLPPESGADLGRKEGTRLRICLTVVVDDVDRFIAGPDRRALLRGYVTFDELGGRFEIERGHVQLLPGRPDRSGRMYYSIGTRVDDDTWVTYRGVKFLTHRRGAGAIIETTSMQVRVLRGPPEETTDLSGPGEREMTIATGVVRLTASALVRGLASFRPRARSRTAGALAVTRFWTSVAGAIADVYVPRPAPGRGQLRFEPRPPIELPPRGQRLITAESEPRAPVSREVVNLARWTHPLCVERWNLSDEFTGSRTSVERVTDPERPPGPMPVLLIAGSSVGASIFRPAGVQRTIIHRLIEQGYDVWVESWRGSLGNDPVEYSLDQAAVLDHPRAVRHVARHTNPQRRSEPREVRALVHCLGSSGFMLALAGGLLHTDDIEVTRVVSNAVSLHPVLPHAAEQKLRAFIPVYNRLIAYLDPQWARGELGEPLTDAPHADLGSTAGGPFADVILEWVRLTHQECEDPVCNFGQFMYGSGPSTLYEERRLQPETRTWMRDQLAWAPIRLYRQISRSLLAGHLVPMQEWGDALPADLFEAGPARRVDTRITFISGSENRCFSPLSQRRTHEWFSAFQPNRHEFKPIDGYGHLDVWLRDDADPVAEAVLNGLG